MELAEKELKILEKYAEKNGTTVKRALAYALSILEWEMENGAG